MTFEMDRVIIDEWRRAYVLDSQQSGESGVGIECPWKFSVSATSGQQAKQKCCLVLCSSQAAEVDSCDQRASAESAVKSTYITCCLAENGTPTELAAYAGRKTIGTSYVNSHQTQAVDIRPSEKRQQGNCDAKMMSHAVMLSC